MNEGAFDNPCLSLLPSLGLALILTLAGCQPKTSAPGPPEKMVVSTQRAEAMDSAALSRAAAQYIANVSANEETDFSFKVGGIVDLIGPMPGDDWKEGSPVKAGGVLARLEQSDFKNALASAQAAAALAGANNERARKLLAGSASSRQDADKAAADAANADAQLQQAEQNLRDSELRAPWDGVVFTRYVDSGQIVSAGKPVLRFGDIATMSVELGVPDRLVNSFAVGHEIAVNITALPGRPPFAGRISEVGVSASNQGRLYRIVIKVPNPDGLIKSGMTATVQTGSLAGADAGQVQVPLSALVSPPAPGAASGKPPTQLAVFVVSDGKARLRPVKTGDIVASSIFVTSGLAAGEEVVTRGASLLYDGAPVAVR
jgi:membrane fusion protein (multidrug efflux system)